MANVRRRLRLGSPHRKADFYMVSADGRDADNIKFGSTLSGWQLGDRRYDYQCANPPYGKDWEMDQPAVEAEAERGFAGRFGAGLPLISDGQLLFLQHMLARMKEPKDGGGRVAIVMNGSPPFYRHLRSRPQSPTIST